MFGSNTGALSPRPATAYEQLVKWLQDLGMPIGVPSRNEQQCAVRICISVANSVVVLVTVLIHTCLPTQEVLKSLPTDTVSAAAPLKLVTIYLVSCGILKIDLVRLLHRGRLHSYPWAYTAF
jgi:hypothetical protein